MSSDRDAAAFLSDRIPQLAAAITERQFQRNVRLAERYGPAGRAHCNADAAFHLRFLAQAVRHGAPQLFVDYIGWAKIMLASRGVPAEDLRLNLDLISECATEDAPPEIADEIRNVTGGAIARFASLPDSLELLLDGRERESVTARYLRAVLGGDRRSAMSIVFSALDDGMTLPSIYLDVLERAQIEVGRMWQANRISVAQEHYSSAATQLVMSQLFARVMESPAGERRIVAACVGDELHEIGLRIVSDLLELSGWATHYLGANVPASSIVDAAVRTRANVIALSTTLTPHVAETERVIGAIRDHPQMRGVPILVGGAPFRIEPSLWKRVGADASAGNARDAVEAAGRLVA